MDDRGAGVRLEARRIEYGDPAKRILRGGWAPDNDSGSNHHDQSMRPRLNPPPFPRPLVPAKAGRESSVFCTNDTGSPLSRGRRALCGDHRSYSSFPRKRESSVFLTNATESPLSRGRRALEAATQLRNAE